MWSIFPLFCIPQEGHRSIWEQSYCRWICLAPIWTPYSAWHHRSLPESFGLCFGLQVDESSAVVFSPNLYPFISSGFGCFCPSVSNLPKVDKYWSISEEKDIKNCEFFKYCRAGSLAGSISRIRELQKLRKHSEAWLFIWVLQPCWGCESGPMSTNKLSHGISGASIHSWAPAGQRAQAKCFQEIAQIFRTSEKVQFEPKHKQV